LAVGLGTVALTVGSISASAVAGGNGPGTNHDASATVTICHRTNSPKHPYVEQRVAAQAVLRGHGRHHAAASVWSPAMSKMRGKHKKWGDIIPAFDVDGQHFAGLNLETKGGTDGDTSGQEILDAHCQVSGGS
jgi:hypothetical protein